MTDKKRTDELHVRSFDARSRTWYGVRKRTGEEDTDCYLEPPQDGAPFEDGDEILSASAGRPGVLQLQSHYVHKGPPRVASTAFRSGWDATFGKKKDTSLN